MIGMEYLTNEHYTHLNVGDDISKWTTADMKVLQEDTAWTIKAIEYILLLLPKVYCRLLLLLN